MQPSLLQYATWRVAVLVFQVENPLKSTTRTIRKGRVSPAWTGLRVSVIPVEVIKAGSGYLPMSSVSHLAQPGGRKFVTAL